MIVTAHTYLKQCQRLLREQKQDFENPDDLLSYINIARREVAGRTQCVRRLTPISGQVVSATVTNPGSGYVSPVATITSPDFPSGSGQAPNGRQATTNVQLIPSEQIILGNLQPGWTITSQSSLGYSIAGIEIQDGGDGYFEPQITITDLAGVGQGATATLSISPINTLNIGQEVYPFSDIYLGNWPGVDSVYAIKSASVIYSNYRYTLPMYAFTTYQAQVRQYPVLYQYVPTFCSQFGQGAGGSFYAYPLPSQTYQWEFDCFCLPQDMLLDNSIPEVIPQPWTDAVQYMAVSMAFMELQNLNAAKFYEDMFDKRTLGYSGQARPGRAVNPYGRF